MDLRAAPDPILGQADNFLAVLERVSRAFRARGKPVVVVHNNGGPIETAS